MADDGEPPDKLEDWPGGKAKYQTYGGPDSEGGYEDGATAKLGPSNLRHHEDGRVTIDGEEVDDPDEYKGEPIPGGPSDPDAPPDPAMIGQDDEDDSDDDESGDDRPRGEGDSDDDESGEDQPRGEGDSDDDESGEDQPRGEGDSEEEAEKSGAGSREDG